MIRSQSIRAHRARSWHGLPAAVLLAVLLTGAAWLLIPRIGQLLDSIDFGYPRTMHLAAHVGHEDGGAQPTRFIAMNLDRQVIVVEIPGGDVAKTRTLTGPYLFGAGEDLTPVRIRLELVNGDNEPDLVVSIKREEIIYINDGGSFRLINDAERAALKPGG